MNRINFAVFFAILFLVSAKCTSAQTTVPAASCNWSDVNAVINGPTHTAIDGDTINVPSGTCAWSSQLVINVGVSIIGAGSSSTIIQDNYTGGSLFAVTIPSATSSTFRLSAMSLHPGTGSGWPQPTLAKINGTCNSSTCSAIRLDNLDMTGWSSPTNSAGFLFYIDNVFGVIDHNTISFNNEFFNIAHSAYGGVGAHGDNSWAAPDSFGTRNALYIEHNTVSTTDNKWHDLTDTDNDGGGRFVVRFNTLTNAAVGTHGTESTGRPRGARHVEIYSNTFTCTDTGSGCSLAGIRSGTLLTFNNTLIKSGGWFNSEAALNAYRSSNSFSPWGACNGYAAEAQWDSNDGTTYDSGTLSSATGGSGNTTLTITNTSKSWTANQWVASGHPYSIVNVSRTDSRGFHLGAEITSNTSNTITSTSYGAWNGAADSPAWVAGDSYQILRASVCIDQPGRGGNGATLLSGTTPSPTGWVNEPLDPIYEWGTTVSGGGTPNFGWVSPNGTQRLIANRDFYTQNASFNGTSGTGTGPLASRPSTCSSGVAYWATDQGNWNQSGNGGQGQLYLCTAANTWTFSYTPYAYPHPLSTGTKGTPPEPPSSLQLTVR